MVLFACEKELGLFSQAFSLLYEDGERKGRQKMRFQILHQSDRRIRLHILQEKMSFQEADTLLYFVKNISGVTYARVSERTLNVTIKFEGKKEDILRDISEFSYHEVEVPSEILAHSGRELNHYYEEKLIMKIVMRYAKKLFLPFSLRLVFIGFNATRYILKGLGTLFKKKIDVSVLDGLAIGASLFQKDYNTAGSVMFLLGIGELLEEWTHKKAVGDLARALSLNAGKVWVRRDGTELLVETSDIKVGEEVIVHVGTTIPFDGVVSKGEAMVNQASMTGESVPVRKTVGVSVYAGTVVEEGQLRILVQAVGGNSRFEKIVKMIEETEKLKGGVESKAEKLADKLVPYTLFGTGLIYILTRNIAKAISVLMVDFSCALKLAMPVSVLSAIREAGKYGVTVKGGKFLEAIAEAETIVFDKTGTLTKAEPTLSAIIPFNGLDETEILRISACMEEHFPHSVANAVVNAAAERGITHEEMHTKINYIVAHGISTTIDDKKAIIGSEHFIFDDEKTVVPEDTKHRLDELPKGASYLYLAIDGKLEAVLCITDSVRPEAKEVIRSLREAGIKNVVMMTGDNEKTARVIAEEVGIDTYYAGVLPEDKAKFVEKEKAKGRKVIMIGDGINDSPALSAADCGIAVSQGAELAREIADVTISGENLEEILKLRLISNELMARIQKNYWKIVGINGGLIALGVFGLMPPALAALIHNTSTLAIGVDSMTDLL